MNPSLNLSITFILFPPTHKISSIDLSLHAPPEETLGLQWALLNHSRCGMSAARVLAMDQTLYMIGLYFRDEASFTIIYQLFGISPGPGTRVLTHSQIKRTPFIGLTLLSQRKCAEHVRRPKRTCCKTLEVFMV